MKRRRARATAGKGGWVRGGLVSGGLAIWVLVSVVAVSSVSVSWVAVTEAGVLGATASTRPRTDTESAATTVRGPVPTAAALLAQSIAHHDPRGVWGQRCVHLEVEVRYSEAQAARRGQAGARRELWLDPGHARFRFVDRRGGHTIEYRVEDGVGDVWVDGRSPVSEAEKTERGVRDPLLYRDYHEYLFGLPMKLRDPGTLLEPRVHADRFDGRAVWRLRVRYEEAVGRDLWDFFFEPEGAALVGARFYHDEAAGDGEFLVFRDEIVDEETGLRLPRSRAWYTNADKESLGTDEVVRMEVLAR